MSNENSHDLRGAKHDFGGTYNAMWPDRYLRAHGALDYVIPQQARNVFEPLLLKCMRARGKDRLKIVDVGCSYGINASLLNYDVSLDELYVEARDGRGVMASRDIDVHRRYFAARARRDLPIIGIDPSYRAANYALDVGLITAAVTSNLEHQELKDHEIAALHDCDLIISTGCVGYVTGRTFQRLYSAVASSRPWVGCFVMHPFSYRGISNVLAEFGLVTEEFPELQQRQRRFSTPREKKIILKSMRDAKMDDRYERTTGYIYASYYLSKPA